MYITADRKSKDFIHGNWSSGTSPSFIIGSGGDGGDKGGRTFYPGPPAFMMSPDMRGLTRARTQLR